MGSFSIWHWIIVLSFALVLIVPFWRIFRRTGIPPILSILAVLPFVTILYLWVVAFKKWPGDQSAPGRG